MTNQRSVLVPTLAASIVLNVAAFGLLTYRYVTRPGPEPAPVSAPSAGTAGLPRSAGSSGQTSGLGAEVIRLQSLGLTRDETVPIVLHELLVSNKLDDTSAGYWKSDWQGNYSEALLTHDQQLDGARVELVATYGQAVESAEPLQEIFRPLQNRLPFLTPAEQRAVVRYRLERQAQSSRSTPPAPTSSPDGGSALVPPPGNVHGATHAEFMQSLPKSISADHAYEYALRESPLAVRLRAANADLTEQEFRSLFAAIASAEQRGIPVRISDVQDVAKYKVLKVLSMGDPAWRAVQSTTAAAALNESQMWAIYEVLRTAQGSLAALVRPNELVQPDALIAVRRDRDEQISRIVGPDVAAMLIAALNDSYRTAALGPCFAPKNCSTTANR
jgi:hypothetical protein